MGTGDREGRAVLSDRYEAVRALTETLAEPLSAEDQTVQSMPDVSPTKWHRGHTSWFFETFLLAPADPAYERFHPRFAYIFNSYYEALGARHPRSERGLISRPGVADVTAYRRHVDEAMGELLDRPADGDRPADEDRRALVELGLHHEQQHQELLLMDIKHVLSISPLQPAYRPSIAPIKPDASTASLRSGPGWWEHEGGGAAIGHRGPGFGFDNESPRHTVHLAPFALADRTVTCGEWLAFMDDGGYQRPELWLSDGWTLVRQHGWRSPLYWSPADNGGDDVPGGDGGPGGATGGDGDWQIFTLSGPRPVDPSEPVCHVSYYEADAFAHWTGYRLPTEAEWEVAAQCRPARGGFLQLDTLHPEAAPGTPFGGVWQWTSSAYSPYPGFRTATGALGEYNGKFMVNQQVLRGGSCVTPPGHVRASYRNFFPPSARWPFAGLRLARDLEGPR